MLMHKVKTPEDALSYMVDCTLATVEHMATLKRVSKYAYDRQVNLAQIGYEWMTSMKIPLSGTRAELVLQYGSVSAWAAAIGCDPDK